MPSNRYVLSCSCGAPARFQPPPFESDSRCRACLWRDLVARLPRAASWGWETYPRHGHLRRPYEAARDWFADYLNGAEPGNLFIFGPPGVGKSGLVWCIARSEVEAGEWVEFVNVRRWLRDLRASYGAGEPAEFEEPEPDPYERLRDHSYVLVLDDLGAERPTPHALEEIAVLIEERYDAASAAPTIVTSNYSPAELARQLGGRRNAVAGERIVSRLLDGARRIEIDGPNLRLSAETPGEPAPRLQVLEGAAERSGRDEETEREEEA